METAAALLAGAAAFFAGFCLGALPPAKARAIKLTRPASTRQDKFFENFLNYNGEIQP
ncbi:MAG: hypothetical protein IK086_00215 [Clostridia bacterium]|nr:hypothetical protein [Clostridia bacterium]